MNGAHVYRPLVAFAGSVLGYVGYVEQPQPAQFSARDAEYLPGCFESMEYLGDKVDSNHHKLFRLFSEAELLASDHARNYAKRHGIDLGARFRLQREIAESRFA